MAPFVVRSAAAALLLLGNASADTGFAEVASRWTYSSSTDEALGCVSDVDLIEPSFPSLRPMFDENRAKALAELQAKPGDLIVLIGDELETRTGSDSEILFRQASNVWYMADLDRPDSTLLIDPVSGNSTVLVNRQSTSEDTFNGKLPAFAELAAMHQVDSGAYTSELGSIIRAQYPGGTIFTNDAAALAKLYPAAVPSTSLIDGTAVAAAIQRAREIKSEFELAMMRHSSQVGADAHVRAWATTVTTPPLNNEFVVGNEFEHSCYSCGLRFQARRDRCGLSLPLPPSY